MSTSKTVTEPTMYCRACSYVLDGLTEHRCPECGRAFDPELRRTYRMRPKRRRRWLILLLVALLFSSGWFVYRMIIFRPTTVRVRFDPEADTKGFTSWTKLSPMTLPSGQVSYMAMCNVQIGGQFPVQLDGETLFNVRMTDGDAPPDLST